MQHKQSSSVYILRFIAFLLFIGSLGFMVRSALSDSSKRPLCRRCNVILIAIDNLRADALPCYGYGLNTAPNICKFAGQNIQFSRAYANSSWTLPSEVSLFTGLYPTSHGIGQAMLNLLNPTVNTLPKVLQKNGYQTTVVTNIQANVGLEQGLGKGFTTIQLTERTIKESTPALLTAITAIKTANYQHKPAFVFFHTDGVHDYLTGLPYVQSYYPLDPAYHPPDMPKDVYTFTYQTWKIMQDRLLYITHVDTVRNATHRYTNWYEQLMKATTVDEAKAVFTALPADDQNEILWESGNNRIRAFLGPSYVPLSQHLYDEAVRNVDAYLGQVFTLLDDLNLTRNTIVIVTSEHGEFLGERGIIGHGTKFFDPEIHVPLIMQIPTIKPTHVNTLTALIDMYRTIFDLLGINTPQPESSISQLGSIRQNPNAPKRTFVISEWYEDTQNKSILTDEWHLLETKTNRGIEQELYRIASDPEETKNVSSVYPLIVESLAKILHTTLRTQPVYAPQSTSFPDWIDNEHRRKLIQTGYF